MHGVEFYGQLSFLKAGLLLQRPHHHRQPDLRARNPDARPRRRARRPAAASLARSERHPERRRLRGVESRHRRAARRPTTRTRVSPASAPARTSLQKRFGLAQKSDALLFGVVSRLTEQKGLDLLLEAVPEIVKRGGQLVVFGTGDPALENGLKRAAHAHPESVAVELGFDETLAHTIIAGSDVIAVPSRFEPCGLTQLYALAYGSLPLVHRVGGLADTVVRRVARKSRRRPRHRLRVRALRTEGASRAAIRRAFALYDRRTEWKATQRRAMRQDFGWGASAERYLALVSRTSLMRSGGCTSSDAANGMRLRACANSCIVSCTMQIAHFSCTI